MTLDSLYQARGPTGDNNLAKSSAEISQMFQSVSKIYDDENGSISLVKQKTKLSAKKKRERLDREQMSYNDDMISSDEDWAEKWRREDKIRKRKRRKDKYRKYPLPQGYFGVW